MNNISKAQKNGNPSLSLYVGNRKGFTLALWIRLAVTSNQTKPYIYASGGHRASFITRLGLLRRTWMIAELPVGVSYRGTEVVLTTMMYIINP